MPFINAALGNPSNQSNQSAGSNAITADMLQQALASAQASMQQTGQSTDQLQQTQNRNLGQAAQEVVSGKVNLIIPESKSYRLTR